MNNSEYNYNKEWAIIYQKPDEATGQTSTCKKHLKLMRRNEFKKYNRFFENEMNKTVQNNNREIYHNCVHFIKQHCIKFFSKDVPCNVVITNCESSSNNETQFNSLFEALKKEQILNFVIDEKKCGTTKNMISYIQKAVNELVGEESVTSKNRTGGDHSDDEIRVQVSSEESSSDGAEVESDDEIEVEKPEFVSPNVRKTADEYEPKVYDNESIDQHYRLSKTTQSDYSKVCENSKPYGESSKQNGCDDAKENDRGDTMKNDKNDTSATDKIGFSGIKKIILRAAWKSPIVIVIKNIKTFPNDNLNDLIYLVKKYRAKHRLKLCLMLGVQSNSYEDLMSKISITTSNFIIVKKFYFPSMKKILLEVIYRLLKSDKNIYLFGQDFLKTIIENIQVYGLSLEKFKRIIHYMLASCFNLNDYFYVNALVEKGIEEADKAKLIDDDEDELYFQELIQKLSKHNKCLEELDNCLQTTVNFNAGEHCKYTEEELKQGLCNFYRKKMKFFKAYEIIEDICVSCLDKEGAANASVFKHCFLLNLFSWKNIERFPMIKEELKNIVDFKNFVQEVLLKKLSGKTSTFVRESYRELKKKIEQDIDVKQDMVSKKLMTNSKRNDRLLQAKDVNKESKTNEPLMREKTQEDYKYILYEWLDNFVRNHLNLKLTEMEMQLFILNSKEISERISPDIQGKMTKALMFSGEIISRKTRVILERKGKRVAQSEDQDEEAKMIRMNEQDTTKLMEGYKYYGKDIDVNEWYKSFKSQLSMEEDPDSSDERKITERFLKALGDLKFMGYISESGRGTYIFKRNYFGKNVINL